MSIISNRSRPITNALHEEDLSAIRLRSKGIKVTSLNIGDPAVYFDTPQYIIDAYIKALNERKTSYSTFFGIKEYREAIVNRYKRIYGLNFNDEDIIVTQGVSESLYFLNAATIDKGDRAILFRPYYTPYMSYFSFMQGIPIFEDYDEKREWEVNAEALENRLKKDPKSRKAKYLIVTNPNNPTGTVLGEKTLKRIVEIANDYGLLLVSDEIYDEIIFNGAKFTSMAKLAKGTPHLILNGASKVYDSTGFRIGYTIVPEQDKVSRELKAKLMDLASVRLCPNTPAQYALAEGLNNVKEHEKAVTQMVKQIGERVNFAAKMVNESEYMQAVLPRGAYYLFPKLEMKKLRFKNDKEFIHKLLEEEHVQIARGSAFGGEDHVRIVALAPKEILKDSIEKIEDFCERHSR